MTIRIAVWKRNWLPGSETFIRNQLGALRRVKYDCVGVIREESPLANEDDIILFPANGLGKLHIKWLSLTGRSRRVTRFFQQRSYDLVHVHFGSDVFPVIHALRLSSTPYIVTVHGKDVTAAPKRAGMRGRLYRRRLGKGLGGAAYVIAVSDFIAAKAIECGANPQHVIVHHIGIPIPEPDTQDPKWDIVFVGRLVEKKGVDDLFRACANLQIGKRRPRILIVGTGPLEASLRQFAEDLGLCVDFAGQQNPSEVRNSLRQSRIFVGPSKTARDGDAEGLGMVFLEAAAAGLPVVAYNHGGVGEAVEHGRTGFLAPEGDVDDLSRFISELLRDPDLQLAMGQAGRQRVEREFSVETQTRQLEMLLSSVPTASDVPTKRGY